MNIEQPYRISKIPKGRGLYRSIYIPNKDFRKQLRAHLPYLLNTLLNLDKYRVCHAFVNGKNCASNALQHIGYKHTICLDLKSFFDSVRVSHVAGKLTHEVISQCFIDDAPRQGLPTSPLISNIALVDSDTEIFEALKLVTLEFAYTRYADDICISVDDIKAIPKIRYIVSNVLSNSGFELNNNKTRVQHQSSGRRIITGIGVDEEGLHPTRKTLRNIRAAAHQRNQASADGLREWSKCKLPGSKAYVSRKSDRQPASPQTVTCEFCYREGLQWHHKDERRKILVDKQTGIKHICPELPKPYSKDDVKLHLKSQMFEEFSPISNTWAIGYFRKIGNAGLYILFRKNGVDIGFQGNLSDIVKESKGQFSMKDKNIVKRWSYAHSASNVHEDIIDAVNKCIAAGKSITISCLDK